MWTFRQYNDPKVAQQILQGMVEKTKKEGCDLAAVLPRLSFVGGQSLYAVGPSLNTRVRWTHKISVVCCGLMGLLPQNLYVKTTPPMNRSFQFIRLAMSRVKDPVILMLQRRDQSNRFMD